MMAISYENLSTPLEFFYKWEKETPENVFLRQPFGKIWKTLTFAEAGLAARKMTTALQQLGLEKGDHIFIISKNCYHWILADLAIMMGGYVSVPLYANLTESQVAQVIEKSDAKAGFVGKLDHWTELDKGIPDDMRLIRFPHYPGNAEVSRGLDWDDLIEKHNPLAGEPVPTLDQTWSILFTSGTTGTPKGVIHDYENAAMVMANEVQNNLLKVLQTKEPAFFSFLPLNHIAERTAVEIGALLSGGSISFAESINTFAKNLQDTQPTFFFAVPRIWTKFHLAILSKMPQKKLDRLLGIPILSGLVQRKIKKSLGLSRASVILTGASITPENLKQWYQKLGINLREVYGMTENFGGFTLMPEFEQKPNTVGKPVPGSEGKINSSTGEIMMKMPWMMKGYYKEPEKTAEVLKDGWLHTGDKGEMDADGFIRIIGRVKDAFKTTKGKYIVPTTIEAKLSENELIEQICVAGLGLPQPIVLVNLSEIGWAMASEQLTNQLRVLLEEVNQTLAGHEKLSTLVVIRESWSIENLMLTPTLKIRRGIIDERFKEQYLHWHSREEVVVWE